MIFNRHIQQLVLLFAMFQLVSCDKTDWRENFKEKEKSPFGTYIIHKEAKALFDKKDVIYIKDNVYDYLFKNNQEKFKDSANYICIKHTANKLTKEGFNYLLDYVHKGNDAFYALNYFNKFLKDTLQVATTHLKKVSTFSPEGLKTLKGKLVLENKTHTKNTYNFDRNLRPSYFSEYNKKTTIVLGNIIIDGEKKPNFIKVYHGSGAIYLHAQPIVFTNYFLLKGKEAYAEKILSYLPSKNIIWDSHIKSSKYLLKEDNQKSVFMFFLQHKTLTWFLAVSSISLLLFMLFNARRKQRPIPVISPLKNSTIEFAQTISNLYLKEEDHKNLANKKIVFFLEKVRIKYLLNTSNLNDQFITKLASKSGNSIDKTRFLIKTIVSLNKEAECSEEKLIALNKMIENFLNKK